jgi:hypothetical protein
MMMIIMKDTAMVVNDEDEEDSSITSTVPVTKDGPCCNNSMDVDDAITESSCDSSSNDKTQKRKVHFDESQNKSHVDTRQCLYDLHEYRSDVWYNALDYQQFKMTTSHIASRIAHASTDHNNNNSNNKNDNDDDPFARSYYKVLLRTYQACCQTAASCGNNSSDDHEMILDMMNDDTNNSKCIFESATEQAHAQQWIHAACANGALLGVAEKHSIYEVVLDRLHRRMELVSAIFEIQEFCTRHLHATDNDGKAAVAEMMRVASCEKSRPSRLFAQVWAQAVL